MAQSQTGDDDATPARISAADVYEGDRVLMGINWHGEAHEGFYHRGLYQSVVEGTVIDAPRDSYRESLREGERLMVDFAVETDDGDVFRWNVDNGYVLGFHPGLDRRSDVGRFGGFYETDD